MAEPMPSLVLLLRMMRAEGVPAEQHVGRMLAEAMQRLGQDGAAEWLSSRLAAADRVIERVRARTLESRIQALEQRVRQLEAAK